MAKNIENYASLNGLEKVAIILLSITEENVSKAFRLFDEEEIKEVSHVMSTLGTVKPEIIERVINEFLMSISQNVSFVGNLETTERLLKNALGKDRVNAIMEEIRGPAGRNTWDKLANVNEEMLASYLRNEYPQTIALVMTKINSSHSARVLSVLPEDLAFEVMMRMLSMESVKKEVLDGIEKTLRAEFISTVARTQKLDSNELMAEIFNNFDRTSEAKYMSMLEDHDPEAAEKIKSLMFTFDDLMSLDTSAMQVLLRKVDKSVLPIALKGANEEIKTLFFNNMSTRAAKLLSEEMETLGPIRLRDVDEAQGKVILTVKDLAGAGEISIEADSDDDMVY